MGMGTLDLVRGLAALVAVVAVCPRTGWALHKRHAGVAVAAASAAPAAVQEAVEEAGPAPSTAPWGVDCPDGCTCRQGPYRDVPLRRLMASLAPHLSLGEEPLRSELDADRPMRQAVCVILSDTYEDVFAALPRDTQALTLLQSADEAAVVLTASLLSPLSALSSLDVTAFAEAGVLLRSDAVRPLARLRLLSLTGVKLEGALEEDNEVIVTSPPPTHGRRRRLPPWAYRTDGQGEDLPQLVFLKPAEVVSFSKFSEIRRANALRTFDGLENLVMLRLHHADLVDLAWEMFNGLENLQVLSLEHNGLAYVPDWSLYGAPALRYLSLAHNSLLDVSSTALVGLLELRFFDLSHNNLSHLSELSLPPFPRLRGADFRANPIEAIFTSTFQIMNSTETLLLGGSGTALQLHADMFLGLRALRRLVATDVAAPALHRDLLRGMPRLRDLTLRGVIPSLPYDAFVEVPKLERLVLRQCGIRHVSMDAFYALFALQELDLSHNQLQALPPSLLDQQGRLRELLLTGNQLKELPAGFLDLVPAKMVRLDGNPWDCSCEMASWNPTATNKDKRDGRFVYEKRVAPTCATPERYAGWDVYDAMRRGFRCNKNPSRRLRLKPNALPAIATATSTTTARAPTTPAYLSNVVPGRDDAEADTAPAKQAANATSTSSPPALAAAAVSSAPSPTPWSSPSPGLTESTVASESPASTLTSSVATATESPSPDATPASTTWSSSSTARAPLPPHHHRRPGPGRPGHRKGKHRHHPHPHRAPGAPDHGQQGAPAAPAAPTSQEEGAVTAEGKYLLSDGKGGFIAVSKKAFKAALEERRSAGRRLAPTAAPATA